MAKRSKESRRQEPLVLLAEPIPRIATRRATADRKLRILERLTSGLSTGHIARVEQLTVRRARQIIAEMLEKREVDPPDSFVQPRVGKAVVVAHTMMMQGDLQATDRLLELNGELDRYRGFGRAQLGAPAEAAPPRLVPSPCVARGEFGGRRRERKFSSPQTLEKSRNQKILAPTLSGE